MATNAALVAPGATPGLVPGVVPDVVWGGLAEAQRARALVTEPRRPGSRRQLDGVLAIVAENVRLSREVLARRRDAEELRGAAEIQRALMPPRRFESALVELAADSTPCRQVGGDLYDYAPDGEGGLTLTLADVAGKGTSAAILTAVVQGLLAGEAGHGEAPDTALTRINQALCRRPVDGRFVTAFHAHLARTGRLRYSNAGHNAPVLIGRGTCRRLPATGCPLGLFEEQTYELAEVQVSTGDLLVAFSDGVAEASDETGDEFGDERVLRCVREHCAESAKGVLSAIQAEIDTFAGSCQPKDDVTLMVLRLR